MEDEDAPITFNNWGGDKVWPCLGGDSPPEPKEAVLSMETSEMPREMLRDVVCGVDCSGELDITSTSKIFQVQY